MQWSWKILNVHLHFIIILYLIILYSIYDDMDMKQKVIYNFIIGIYRIQYQFDMWYDLWLIYQNNANV